MIQIGTILQDRYLVQKQIGAGGMGAVYLAVDQRFDNTVALKETFYKDEHLRHAFEREAKLLNSLHHPVLPHVSDYFTEGGGHFIVMEFIEGEDLSAVLERKETFPVEQVLRWTDALLDALDFLHSQEPPIIHRDIKPENLKITPRGDIVLLDFGLAKLSSTDNSSAKSVFGYSRKYSPLEQIQGVGTDARSDIFALGATVFHLLTGKQPADALARAASIIAGKPDPLRSANELNPDVPLAVAQVLETALALNADLRFVSADAMRQALQHAVVATEIEDENDQIIENGGDDVLNHETVGEETENFPALAAFAAELENHPAVASDSGQTENLGLIAGDEPEPIQIEASPTADEPQQPTLTNALPVTAVRDEATRVRRRPSKFSFPVPALAAAVLLLMAAATWFAVNRASSSPPPAQTPIVQEAPTPTAESVDDSVVSTEPTPVAAPAKAAAEVEKPSAQVRAAQKREQPAPEKEQNEKEQNEKETVRAEPEVKKPEPPPAVKPSRPAAKPVARRNDDQPPVSSIENVLTGGEQPVWEERRPRRVERPRRNRMSEQEKEELRRRRTEDILRRNRQPLPRN